MSNRAGSVLIAGASAAGLATAESLRRQGYEGQLRLLDTEPHQPYDRPPLSKHVLTGAWEASRARLRTPEHLASLHIELLLGEMAVNCDAENRTVTTASGSTLRADTLVIATGLRAAALPGQEQLAGVHSLRGLDDSLRLRGALSPGTRLVVIGTGVLGAEIAASARGMGAEVTIVGPDRTLLGPRIGDRLGEVLTRLHRDKGVHDRLGTVVDSLTGAEGKVTGVRLDTGEQLPTDLVVSAIGGQPATDWLQYSGITLDDGIVCDSRCLAAEGIYAVGDVCSWHHEALDSRLRLENRTNAVEQAQTVAANILGAGRPYTPTPYFWTDQYAAKIQLHGLPFATDDVIPIDGEPGEPRFTALYTRDGHATGVLGWNMPKQARLLRGQHLVPAVTPAG